MGLAERGAVALDGGHLFAGLGQGGNKGGQGQHVGGQGGAPVLTALGSEASPVPGVGALGVGRALLAGVNVACPGFGVLVDVASCTDGLRGSKLGKRFHEKGGRLVREQGKNKVPRQPQSN